MNLTLADSCQAGLASTRQVDQVLPSSTVEHGSKCVLSCARAFSGLSDTVVAEFPEPARPSGSGDAGSRPILSLPETSKRPERGGGKFLHAFRARAFQLSADKPMLLCFQGLSFQDLYSKVSKLHYTKSLERRLLSGSWPAQAAAGLDERTRPQLGQSIDPVPK